MRDLEPLWQLFEERLSELGGHVIHLDEEPRGACLLRHLDDLGINAASAAIDSDAASILALEPTAGVWTADIGVTTAICAVAETGSVMLQSAAGRQRMASLAPPTHVALVYESDIHATLEEAFERVPAANTVLISGPSRTADIEGVLVRGVHGPRHVVIARMPDAVGRN